MGRGWHGEYALYQEGGFALQVYPPRNVEPVDDVAILGLWGRVAVRRRPTLMTSLAFILGVLPLVIRSGAGASSRNAIGNGIMGRVISATVLAIFFVPLFFVLMMCYFISHQSKEVRMAAAVESKGD